MIKKLTALLLFILSMSSFTLEGQTLQYENQLVRDIDITVHHLPENQAQAIRARMKTRKGDLFSQTAFDSDLKMLIQDFDRIDPQVESVDGEVAITLHIWPKPVIRDMIWHGNCKVKTGKLLKELGIRPGSIFDRQGFNAAFHKLKAYYVQKGFFEAELDYSVNLDPETNQVDICIDICEGRAGRIKKIRFCNFTKAERTELTQIMCTKEYNLFLSWFSGTGTYNEDAVQQDKFVILNYLQNKGYADATVDIQVIEAPQSDRIILCITADKGCLYRFGEVTFEGNTLFTDEEIACRLKVKEGCPYSPDILHESLRRLTNLYGRYGYIDTFINYEPRLVEGCNAYSIHITIEEGEKYCVGLIKVFGNCTTQTKVILHETLLTPGEVFNLEKLQKTEIRLRNIGYFKNVNVYAVRSESMDELSGNYRDVHIEVEEGSTGHMGAFFGMSTAESVFGGLNITEKNFNACGLGRLFCDGYRALRGGGEYAHITATVGRKSLSYVFSWTKPHFRDTPWTVGFDLEKSKNRYISDDYTINAAGITIHGSYQNNAYMRTGLHYRFRYSDVKLHENASDKAEDQAERDGIVSAIGATWTYDSTNHPLSPSCGFRSRFETEFAGVGGRYFFSSFAYLNTYFYPVPGGGVIKLRGDLRFLQPLWGTLAKKMPLDEKFFLGGDNAIRGYRPYRPGPKLNGMDDPAGGISLQLYSLEYIYPLFSRVDGFLFLDAGALTDDPWEFGRINYSIGYGARVQVFAGAPPLTIGMGYPLNPEEHKDVKRFFLMVGGKF